LGPCDAFFLVQVLFGVDIRSGLWFSEAMVLHPKDNDIEAGTVRVV
jgi:hypothetical protein